MPDGETSIARAEMSSTETPKPGGEATSDPTVQPARDVLLEPVSRRVAAVWNVAFWYVAQILVLARNIVLVPVFLRYIGEEEYNAWLVSGFVLAQLTSVDFGVMAVLGQRVAAAYGERERERLERLIGGGLLTVCVLAGVVGLATAAVSPFVPGLFDVTPQIAERLTVCFLFVAVANAVQLLGFAASGLLRAFQRAFLPGLFMVLAEAAALATTAVLVIRSGWGLYAIAAGLVARAAVQTGGSGAALCWVGLRQLRLRPVWDGAEARTLWRLSGYQFLSQIAGRFKQSFDASFLGVMLGTEAGGGYSLTIRAHESVRLLAAGVVGAVTPGMAHMHGEGAPERLKGVALTLFKVQALLGAVGFGGVIAFNAAFMRLWVGPDVFSGQAVSVMAAIAAISWLLSTTPYETVMARGGFATITRVVWLDVVLRFAAMAILVRWIGVLATPLASLVCQVLAVLVPLGWIVARALRVSRAELLGTVAGSLKLMLVPLGLAAIVAYALPPAPSWVLLIAEAAVYLVLCALGTWLLDRELVRFALRGGRERQPAAV
jgi:O-antigen/teichoic acid export membrane protein